MQPSKTVWKEGDQYVWADIPASEIEIQQATVSSIIEFINSSAVVVPSPGLINMDEDLKDAIGPGAAASIALAQERQIPIYSDDLVLRLLAQATFEIESVWSQSLLINLHQSNAITETEYNTAIGKLLIANYHFVSVKTEILIQLLKDNGMTLSSITKRILQALEGPDCTIDSAVDLASDLVKRIWLEPVLLQQRLDLLDALLMILVTGRSGRQALAALKMQLRRKMLLLPLHWQTIDRAINAWTITHILPE